MVKKSEEKKLERLRLEIVALKAFAANAGPEITPRVVKENIDSLSTVELKEAVASAHKNIGFGKSIRDLLENAQTLRDAGVQLPAFKKPGHDPEAAARKGGISFTNMEFLAHGEVVREVESAASVLRRQKEAPKNSGPAPGV